MISFIIAIAVLLSGWQAYRSARRSGMWSNKAFFGVLLGALALTVVIALPIYFISPANMEKHFGLAISSFLLAIAVGVTVITIYANRWWKGVLLKRSGQDRTLKAVIFFFLLFAMSASAQTTYRDPGGNFTVSVPAGWQVEKQQDGSTVRISKGDVSVTVAADPTQDGSTPPAKKVLDAYEQQFTPRCPSPEGAPRRGDATVAGLPGLYFQLSCKDPQDGSWMMMFAVATSNGRMLLFQWSAPSSQYSSVKPVLDSMAVSFRPGRGGTGEAAANPASPDAEKLRALEDACSTGVLNADECAAKRAELTKKGDSSNSSASNAQMQALERACKAGVFTAQECEAKRAALTGAGPNNGSSRGNNTGNTYNDPSGLFSLMIPPGWTATTHGGCYGPKQQCPPNSAGVNITQGRSWAFVAPYSGGASQPTDVVRGVAGQYQSEYGNFTMIQNEPSKVNGLDVAFGTFSGIDTGGVTVSLVIVGIAAPNGRYYVASSSVAKSEMQSTGVELTSMLNSLRFAGQ